MSKSYFRYIYTPPEQHQSAQTVKIYQLKKKLLRDKTKWYVYWGWGHYSFISHPFCMTFPVKIFLKMEIFRKSFCSCYPPGEARLAAPSVKSVNRQQEEMSRDVINASIKKCRGSIPVCARPFDFK